MFARYAIYTIIIALAIAIQYPLWLDKGGLLRKWELEAELEKALAENARVRQENEILATEIESLEQGRDAVEERARMRLELIQKDEVLVRFVPYGVSDKVAQPQPDTLNAANVEQPGELFEPKRSDLYKQPKPKAD